jgi:hypothetical protein
MNTPASPDTRSSKQHEGLQKQRRNFVVGSFLLCFVAIGGVSTERITTAGLSLTVNRPAAAYWFIWVAVTYFGIRYSQFLWSERKSLILNTLATSLNVAIARLSLKELRTPSHVTTNSVVPPYKDFEHAATVSWAYVINKRDEWWSIRAEFICPEDLSQPLSETRPIGDIVLSINKSRILLLRAKAILHWVFETPHFTEHIVPYLLFIAAVLVNVI